MQDAQSTDVSRSERAAAFEDAVDEHLLAEDFGYACLGFLGGREDGAYTEILVKRHGNSLRLGDMRSWWFVDHNSSVYGLNAEVKYPTPLLIRRPRDVDDEL